MLSEVSDHMHVLNEDCIYLGEAAGNDREWHADSTTSSRYARRAAGETQRGPLANYILCL